jgi:hypothetical protein
MKIHENYKLGFIFSNWYSGATLLSILLDNQKDIVCNGETFPFADNEIELYTCSCGKPLIQCDFYRNACSHMFDEPEGCWQKNSLLILPQMSRVPLLNNWLNSYNHFYWLRDFFLKVVPPYNVLIERFLNNHINFYQKSCMINGKTFYVDGTKSIRRIELFRLHKRTLLRGIYLVRDGRAFCFSYVKNSKPKKTLSQAAYVWKKYNADVRTFQKRYPEIPILTIRYEDLCHEIESTMKSIISFFGLRSENYQYQEKEFHMLGNKMRKSFDGKILEDLRWKEAFSSHEASTITSIMEEDLQYYGYI